jgi:RNA polymerase sigma-70 factor (ECF subfamily)
MMDPVGRSDAQLLTAIADGDRQALRELHDGHAAWIRARLCRRCRDDDIVSEALQDTFVAVWCSARRWDGRGEPAAWMWGIAIRRLIGVLRSRHRWIPIADPTLEGPIVIAAEEQVLLGVEHGDVGRALDQLSPELRAVIQATVIDGLTTREAGQLLGIPPGTVKTRALRARQQLRGALA